MRALLAALFCWATLLTGGPASAFGDEQVLVPLPGGGLVAIWAVWPDGYDRTKPTTTLLVFPPGQQDMSMVDAAFNWYVPEALARGWLVIGVAAQQGQGFARAGRELIGPLLDELLQRYAVAGGKFHLAGNSNGGNSAFAAALDHPDKFRSLTVLAGRPPEDADFGKLKVLAPLQVNMFVGELDEGYLKPMWRTRDAMLDIGLVPHFEVVPNAEHALFELQRDPANRAIFDLMQ